MIISVKITGDKQIVAKLRKLGQDFAMLRGAMEDIGGEFVDYYSGVAFASEGGVFGERWKTLSPAYQTEKAKRYPGRGILVATGKMKSRFSYKANNHKVVIGNDDEKFEFHQSSAARNRLPRRRMIGINGVLEKKVQVIVEAEINKKLRAAGL